jgi:putative membrane protein
MAERLLPIELIGLAVAYALFIRRRGIRRRVPLEFGRAVCFMAGVGSLAFALVGPVDNESAHALSWHMVQHVLIISVAAPLLAVGRPVELFLEIVPAQVAMPRIAWRGTWGTSVASVAALVVLLGWHVPAFYQAALSNEPVHIVEHLTLLATAMLLWSALIHAENLGASVVWLFVLTLPTTAFGVAMTIARTPWYPDYVTTTRIEAVHDQQMAGVVMWAFGGVAAVAGAVAMFASWLVGQSASEQQSLTKPATSPDVVPTC